jgi:hypothetical protein
MVNWKQLRINYRVKYICKGLGAAWAKVWLGLAGGGSPQGAIFSLYNLARQK